MLCGQAMIRRATTSITHHANLRQSRGATRVEGTHSAAEESDIFWRRFAKKGGRSRGVGYCILYKSGRSASGDSCERESGRYFPLRHCAVDSHLSMEAILVASKRFYGFHCLVHRRALPHLACTTRYERQGDKLLHS